MDVVKVNKIFDKFYIFSLKIFVFLLFISGLSILIGTAFTFLDLPWLGHLLIFGLWASLLFTPQIIVLEELPLHKAIEDAVSFVTHNPTSLLKYLAFGVFLVLIAGFLEYIVGTLLLFPWDKILSTLFTAFFILPLLQIYAAELYLARYPVIGHKL